MKSIHKMPLLLILTLFTTCKSASQKDQAANLPFHPLQSESDLDLLVQKIGDSRVVLLGEASHGTAEYYDWRTAISKKLIQEKGFTIIGVEGEWADSYRVNQFIKGPPGTHQDAVEILKHYDRWPTWMWGNQQVASLILWLNEYNQQQPDEKKAGFFGLDVYCLWESMDELMPYIANDPELTRMAEEVRSCFKPYSADPIEYTMAIATAAPACTSTIRQLYQSVFKSTGGITATDESNFVMQQNALVAYNAENYYRVMARSNGESWNVRDRHMMQTIDRLLEWHGPESKIIVWEHNTHVGDARYTDMAEAGMVNVGQLAREKYGRENVFIVGFGSYKGTVIASDRWDGKITEMKVPPAKRGSWEHFLHSVSSENKMLFSDELRKMDYYRKEFGHRAIGVQYYPNNENGNYVPSVIPDRYDAFLYIDETTALQPIQVTPSNEPPDTYPSGF